MSPTRDYAAPIAGTMPMAPGTRTLIEKIEALPSEQVFEVADFVDFIVSRAQDRALSKTAAETSVSSFAKIWSNPEDDAYDAL